MTTETRSTSDYDLRFAIDEYGYRRKRSQREIDDIKLGRELQEFLKHSTLTEDDKQRLRGLSADYTVACASFPEKNDENDYDAVRSSVLAYLSADLPEATEEDALGLRRLSGGNQIVKITVDGHPLSMEEFRLVYTLIPPSAEVLDHVVEDAAYFYVANEAEKSPVESAPAEPEPTVPAEYDIDYFEADDMPPIEEKHTLRDELRPITDQLKYLGGKVISIVALRPPTSGADESQQKIAS